MDGAKSYLEPEKEKTLSGFSAGFALLAFSLFSLPPNLVLVWEE